MASNPNPTRSVGKKCCLRCSKPKCQALFRWYELSSAVWQWRSGTRSDCCMWSKSWRHRFQSPPFAHAEITVLKLLTSAPQLPSVSTGLNISSNRAKQCCLGRQQACRGELHIFMPRTEHCPHTSYWLMWTQHSRYTHTRQITRLSFQPAHQPSWIKWFDQILSSCHLLDLSNALRHALKLTVSGCICSVPVPVHCSSFCQPRSMARLFSQWLPLAHALIITFMRLVPLVALPERLEWIIPLYRWLAFDSFDASALSFKRAKVLCHSDDRKHAVASAEDPACNSELWCPSPTGFRTWQTKAVIWNPTATSSQKIGKSNIILYSSYMFIFYDVLFISHARTILTATSHVGSNYLQDDIILTHTTQSVKS